MSNLLKYIIIVGYLLNVFSNEKEETILCMNMIIAQFMTEDRSKDDEHLNMMINTYGRDCVERALTCLSKMYKKIV